MTKRMIALTVVMLLALTSLPLWAQQPLRRNFRAQMIQPGWSLLRILKARQSDLKVTDDQLHKIQSLINSFEERMIDLRSQMSKHRLQMRNLFQNKENVDLNQLRRALDEAAKFRTEMTIQRFQLRQEINSVLTPEQKEALKKMQQNFIRHRVAQFRQRQAQSALRGRQGRFMSPRRDIRW